MENCIFEENQCFMKTFILSLLLVLTFAFSQAQSCTQSGSLIIPVGGQNTSTLPLNSYSGIDVVLEGDLIVDNNFEFIGCTLYVAANVSIIVDDLPITFTVRNSNLFSCGTDMWNGIVVKQKSGLDFSRNVIEDAKTGVYTESFFGTVKIIENTFNKNHIHFHAEKANGNNITIYENKFTCEDLGNIYSYNVNTLEAPYLNEQTEKAIWAHNIANTLSIGSPLDGPNEFYYAKFGILLESVAAVIKNNYFENIGDGLWATQANPTYPYYTPYTCILAFCEKADGGCSIEIGGPNSEKNIVRNCNHGFEINSYKYVDIIDNYFTDSNPPMSPPFNGTGIQAIGVNFDYNTNNPVKVKNSVVNIKNNLIEHFRTGIDYYHAYQSYMDDDILDIRNNKIKRITGVNKGFLGIRASGNLTSSSPIGNSQFNISDNEITDLSTGIHILNASGRIPNIENNEIELNLLVLGSGYGIKNENCYYPGIVNNKITGPGYSVSAFHTGFFGIYSSLSDNSFIYCNKINTIGKSIYFKGSTPSIVSGNTIKHAYDGFTMGSNAVIGPQGNSSIPSDNKWMGNFTNSRTYTINTGCNSHSPLYLRSGNLFFPPSGTNLTSSVNSPTEIFSISYGGLILVSNPTPPLICPMNINPQTPLLNLMHDIVRERIGFNQFIPNSHWISKKQVFDAIVKDSSLLLDPIIDSFAISGTMQYINLKQIENLVSTQNFSQAINLSNSFAASNLPEENYQYFYKIYSTYYSGFPLPFADYTKLVEIAEQCPLDGGKAVFEARALRNHIDRWNYEYIDLCEDSDEKSLDNFYTDYENDTHIYPNPCSGVFYLHNRSELELILKLFDFTGREILAEKIEANIVKEIQLKNVNSGIYLYKLINDEIEIKSGKISVIQ